MEVSQTAVLIERVKLHCPFLLYPPGEYPNKHDAFVSSNMYLYGTKTQRQLGKELGTSLATKPIIWNSCTQNFGNGIWLREIKSNFLMDIVQSFSLLWCCYMVVITGISFKCYEKISSLVGRKLENGVLVPIVVDGIELPRFLCSEHRVKERCKILFNSSIFANSFITLTNPKEDSNSLLGYQIHLSSYLSFIFKNNALKQMYKDSRKPLTILVNADALPVV